MNHFCDKRPQTVLEYFKCLLGFHSWHRFSPKPQDWWGRNPKRGCWERFCRTCGYINQIPFKEPRDEQP